MDQTQPEFGCAVCLWQGGAQTGGDAGTGRLYQQIVDVKPKDGNAMVMGYTDRIGSDANNQALSEARASTVANFLIGKGLPADR